MTHLSTCILAFILSLILRAADARQLSAGGGTTRQYFIAANTVTWDYAPSGINQCQGRAFSPAEEPTTIRGLGLKYKKVQYQAYTDETFTKRMERSADEEHLALLGPLLRAEVGDRVVVTLKNNLDFTINFDPAGLLATQAVYNLLTLPNRTEIYEFSVPDEAGPTSTQPSSILWLYRSTAEGNEAAHQNAGLYGGIVVVRRGSADETGKTKDATREIVSIFFVNDENVSPFFDENLARHSNINATLPAEDLTTFNLKFAINGRQYCNLEGLNGKTGEKIRWYSAALGNLTDVHNVHWHGVVVEKDNGFTDQFSLLASNTATADLIADNPGIWMFHCHVNGHLDGGMVSLFNLTGPATGLQNFKSDGSLRTYYVQAQEEVWDIAPSGANLCSGKRENFTSVEAVFVANQPDRIGRKPIKARFVEYTDGNFTTPKVRTAAEIHLGILGPIIRAEVGDTIHVVFRNKVRFPSSMHPHGLLYNKASEGTPYNDGTTGADKADDLVLTNQTHTYVWHVPERSGPGPGEKSSKIWMYHSHSHETADTFAGLMGAIIISRRGSSRPDGTPRDVDREFVLFWMVMDESKSNLFITNLNTYLSKKYIGNGLPQVQSLYPTGAASNTRGGYQTTLLKQPTNEGVAGANPALLQLLNDTDFKESNLKHGINGLVYCNLPGLEAREGHRIRVYHMALGGLDLHTPGIRLTSQDWSSNTVSVVSLLSGDMETADAQLTTPGASVLQCNVAAHITAGMRALFYVQPQNDSAFDAALSQVDAHSHQSAPMAASRGQDPNMTTTLPHSDATSKSAMVTKATAGSLSVPLMDFVYGFEARIRKGLAALGITSPPLQAVAKVASADKPLRQAVTRTYFIQAEQQEWDYAPSKKNRCTGKDFEDNELLSTTKTNETLGPLVMKGVYRAYSDGSFSAPSPHPKEFGILGPLIRVQVGDTLKVVFRNSLHFAVNLVFDGGLIPDDRAVATAPVQPNTTVTITYSVPSTAGPGAKDASTVHYVYHSDVNIVSDMYAGLVGVIMVAQQGTLTPSGGLSGIDVVVPLLFQVWDESGSPYFETNIKKYNPTVDQAAVNFAIGNFKPSINGLLYCNIPDVKLKTGDHVRWLLTGLGSKNDMHSPVFNNQVLEFNHAHVASVELYPAMTITADMVASAPGTFGFRCDVVGHLAGGMNGRMVISQ